MTSILIHDVRHETYRRLEQRARDGRMSMEAQVNKILDKAANYPTEAPVIAANRFQLETVASHPDRHQIELSQANQSRTIQDDASIELYYPHPNANAQRLTEAVVHPSVMKHWVVYGPMSTKANWLLIDRTDMKLPSNWVADMSEAVSTSKTMSDDTLTLDQIKVRLEWVSNDLRHAMEEIPIESLLPVAMHFVTTDGIPFRDAVWFATSAVLSIPFVLADNALFNLCKSTELEGSAVWLGDIEKRDRQRD